jgi:hypothetical protein
MNAVRKLFGQTSQSAKEPIDKLASVHRCYAGRERARARRLARVRQALDQQLAWRVQDILVGCGLSQADYSIVGGRIFHIPHVVSVIRGPPVGLDICILPGQMCDDLPRTPGRSRTTSTWPRFGWYRSGPYLIRLNYCRNPTRLGYRCRNRKLTTRLGPDRRPPG